VLVNNRARSGDGRLDLLARALARRDDHANWDVRRGETIDLLQVSIEFRVSRAIGSRGFRRCAGRGANAGRKDNEKERRK
jgi:hypothetical protein